MSKRINDIERRFRESFEFLNSTCDTYTIDHCKNDVYHLLDEVYRLRIALRILGESALEILDAEGKEIKDKARVFERPEKASTDS